jgi:Uma2 family endonuclease
VEKTMGALESYLAMVLGEYLSRFVRENDLGILLGEAGMLRFSPKRIYLPDISFISWAQNPMLELRKQPVADLHPDLAVEVLSPSNTRREMKNKRDDYFNWGTRLVWQLEPAARTMEVFTAPEESSVVGILGSLDGGDVLPGFSLPMVKLFENTDRFSP